MNQRLRGSTCFTSQVCCRRCPSAHPGNGGGEKFSHLRRSDTYQAFRIGIMA